MQVIVMCNSVGDQNKGMLAGLSQSQACFVRESHWARRHVRSRVPGEEGVSWVFMCARGKGQGCANLCSRFFFPFSFFLLLLWHKGLVFFLADEQKTALCVSVISLPGLAAKLASTAPSVELALRSQCHTEQAASQAAENWLRFWQIVCMDDCEFFMCRAFPKLFWYSVNFFFFLSHYYHTFVCISSELCVAHQHKVLRSYEVKIKSYMSKCRVIFLQIES